jgi:BirA family transcriptional regulator, biotin operon repressor / biotin---[acetyl-CoA-carboxylase] ligase
MPQPDEFLDSHDIRRRTFVRHVELHDTLGSTNDRAVELARDEQVELPALIAARQQTAGRGRGDHQWWSAEGALTFSLLLEPAALGIAVRSWPQLSLTTAVAVCDVVRLRISDCGLRIDGGFEKSGTSDRGTSRRVAIKWPNDVLIDGRKVAGILIESPGGAAPAKDRLIIGIGINVNNSWADSPSYISGTGTAICDATNEHHRLQAVLIDALRAIESRLAQLRNEDAELVQAWQELNALRGQRVIIDEPRRVEGECLEISDDGAVVVATSNGAERIHSGSVRLFASKY